MGYTGATGGRSPGISTWCGRQELLWGQELPPGHGGRRFEPRPDSDSPQLPPAPPWAEVAGQLLPGQPCPGAAWAESAHSVPGLGEVKAVPKARDPQGGGRGRAQALGLREAGLCPVHPVTPDPTPAWGPGLRQHRDVCEARGPAAGPPGQLGSNVSQGTSWAPAVRASPASGCGGVGEAGRWPGWRLLDRTRPSSEHRLGVPSTSPLAVRPGASLHLRGRL